MVTSGPSEESSLYKKIQTFAKSHDIKPEDARIDRVWKAIPGYNGLRVDVTASYKKLKGSNSFSAHQLVYDEIPPKVHLTDLPPNPIFRGNPHKPMVALLINIAWGEEYLPKILKILNKEQVHATFFLDGSWVKKHPDLAMMISEEGHEIGNHAYTHPDLAKSSREKTIQELEKTNEVIEATLDIKPKWFAPPSGSFNEQTVEVAHSLGMSTILWTADTVDWKHPEPNSMVRRVISQTDAGAMILMHPTDSASAGLPLLIHDIKNRGYQLGTVTALMSEKRVLPLKK